MRLKSAILGSTSLAALVLMATPAAAQDEPAQDETQQEAQTAPGDQGDPAQGEESIIVTGLRRSLQSSQNIRRNSDQIVDAIVAEDIGKLPDLNTAQTAARIPGVQVYRQGGEAQNVLVRGLPNFTTTYNGREIFTAETRVVALQDFPSANVAALEVFKTSTADLVGPGLAGLVNVRSRRPFDFSDAQIAGLVWGLYTVQGHEVTPNFNLLATQRWDTDAGEIGILLNVSYTDMQYLDSEISNTDFIADPIINGERVRFPDIQRLFYRSGRRIRPSANAAVQWRPNDALEFYFDFLWQGFRNRIDDRLLAATLFGGQSYSNLVFRDGTNVLSSGTVVNPGGSLFSFQGGTYNRTNTFQYAGGIRYNQDRVHLTLDIARTTSTFRGSTESVDRIWPGPRTVNFDLEEPSFEITGIDFANPSAQIFEGLFEENQESAGQDWQARIDAQYDLDTSFLQNIQIGARYTNRDAQRLYANRFAFLTPLGINAATLPLTFEVFRGVPRSNGTFNWAAPTYESIRDRVVELRQLIITRCPEILVTDPGNGCQNYTTAPITPNTLFTADEETIAGYAQANLGNDDLNGIVGVRVEHIESRVAGPLPTGIPIIDEGSEDTVVLPNASVRARIGDGLQVRAAVSKTVTRPNFTDLVPSIVLGPPPPGGIGTDSDPRRGTGGNPCRNPFTSWNYDASIEYYFARAGFAALSVFHRDIDGFIQQSTFRFDDPTLGVVEITGPVNTGRGRITGAEAQFQAFLDFDFVPDWARGFGVQANVTYLDAETEQPNGQGGLAFFPITDQLNGVSEWNYNLVGMYERHGLAARLSYNGRSSYSATRQFRGDDLYLETARPADRLDLSLNYNLLPNLTIFGDWTNITRTPFRQDFSSARAGAPRAEYIRYLRYDESTLSLGFRFRFGN